ncbi:hypothetical protein, partial [Streptococcus pneumoniae]
VDEALAVALCLHIFADISGLVLNPQKSMFIPFNMDPLVALEISRAMNTSLRSLPFSFLGAPVGVRRNVKSLWQSVLA